jgi:hypothetical protein
MRAHIARPLLLSIDVPLPVSGDGLCRRSAWSPASSLASEPIHQARRRRPAQTR